MSFFADSTGLICQYQKTDKGFVMNNDQDNDIKQEQKQKKRLRRTALIVSGVVVLSAAATEMLLLVLFGRKGSPSTQEFPLKEWAYQEMLEWHQVEYPSGDNLLKGYLVTNPNPKALIVIAHGMKASSDGYEPVVQYFAKKGYAVWIFDGTASGRSEGKRVVGLQQQRYDIRATVDYLRQQKLFQKIPLVLLGHSAGAYGAATEAQQAGAEAVVCVSGFHAPLTTMHHWAKNYTSSLADIQYPFLWARQHLSMGQQTNDSAAEALVDSDIPALVIQGANDKTVQDEISLFYHTRAMRPDNVSFILENDPDFDDHETILFNETEANEELLDEIDTFIRSHVALA